MSDPRYSDPNDPRYLGPGQMSDPVLRRGDGGVWGWIIGIAVVLLVGFILVAGFNGNNHTASNPPVGTTGSGTQSAPPLGTTGQGSPTRPMGPAPSAPK